MDSGVGIVAQTSAGDGTSVARKRYIDDTCKHCGGRLIAENDHIYCSYCGSELISFYMGGIAADIAELDLNSLAEEIEKNRKDFFIHNGAINYGSIDDTICRASLQHASEMLKRGDYLTAIQYSNKYTNTVEGMRIHFLAQNRCRSESYLQPKSLWKTFSSQAIPIELRGCEEYGGCYSLLYSYCEQREAAAKASQSLIFDYINRYLFQDTNIKRISGENIFMLLKRQANELCQKYPVFPEPWIALKLFDKSAVEKMFCAMQNVIIPYDVLSNWADNTLTNIKLSFHKNFSPHTYLLLFSQDEIQIINNEIKKRYPYAVQSIPNGYNSPRPKLIVSDHDCSDHSVCNENCILKFRSEIEDFANIAAGSLANWLNTNEYGCYSVTVGERPYALRTKYYEKAQNKPGIIDIYPDEEIAFLRFLRVKLSVLDCDGYKISDEIIMHDFGSLFTTYKPVALAFRLTAWRGAPPTETKKAPAINSRHLIQKLIFLLSLVFLLIIGVSDIKFMVHITDSFNWLQYSTPLEYWIDNSILKLGAAFIFFGISCGLNYKKGFVLSKHGAGFWMFLLPIVYAIIILVLDLGEVAGNLLEFVAVALILFGLYLLALFAGWIANKF